MSNGSIEYNRMGKISAFRGLHASINEIEQIISWMIREVATGLHLTINEIEYAPGILAYSG